LKERVVAGVANDAGAVFPYAEPGARTPALHVAPPRPAPSPAGSFTSADLDGALQRQFRVGTHVMPRTYAIVRLAHSTLTTGLQSMGARAMQQRFFAH